MIEEDAIALVRELEERSERLKRTGRVRAYVFASAAALALVAMGAGRFLAAPFWEVAGLALLGLALAASFGVGRARLQRTRVRARLKAARRAAGIKPRRRAPALLGRHLVA